MKDLTKKAYDSGRLKDLMDNIDLINFMFFHSSENMEKLGSNAGSIKKIISGKSEKEDTFIIMDTVRYLYSRDPIIGESLRFVRRNRTQIFRYLVDPDMNKTNNVAEHHFSVRSELLKRRFKTREGLLKTSYWYHRLSTKI